MKKYLKLLTFILVSFIFINNVDAGFNCNIDIDETGISPAGFDVVMPKCIYDTTKEPDEYEEVGGRKSSYKAAWDVGLKEVDVLVESESADGKDYVSYHKKVPVCKSSKRKVVAYSSCTATRNRLTDDRSCRGQYNDLNSCNNDTNHGCRWNGSYCEGGTWSVSFCPDGYSVNPNDKSKCIKSYSIEKDGVTGNINAVSLCNSANPGATCTCVGGVKYALMCPVYSCKKEYRKIGACTPDFKLGDTDVYCVNPSQPLGDKYQHDTTFNARDCATSYSTKDCGYANILIEGAFHKNTSNDAINLALRLWSYHTNAAGFEFNKTGIANREVNGGNCNTGSYFMKDPNERPNVYENTYRYIMRTHKNEYFDIAKQRMSDNGYIPTYISNPEKNKAAFNGGDNTFIKPIICGATGKTTDTNKVGVVCGSNKTYRVAFELFFNTMLGNKYMIKHLDNLFGETSDGSTGATMVKEEVNGKDGVWVVIKYEETEFNNIFDEKEVIDCSKLNTPEYREYKDAIEPYCKKQVTYYDPSGNIISKETAAKVCRKNVGCYYETKLEAICSKEEGGKTIHTVKVKEEKGKSEYGVRKYTACGPNTQYQTMFGYFESETPGKTKEKETITTTYYLNYLCGGACKDSSIKTEGYNECKSDEQYTQSISDPSLSCIVNLEDKSEERYYDYSKEFGVNTNFCRVYCSDKIEYTFPGKTTAYSGRYFQYDVRESGSEKTTNKPLISALVKETRTCVSEIFVNNLPTDVKWKKLYGLSDEENNCLMGTSKKNCSKYGLTQDQINSSTPTWYKLFKILQAKAANERSRKENLNQIVYDLYNCNLYELTPDKGGKKGTMSSYGIYKPGEYKGIPYARQLISNKFSSGNDYGIVNRSKAFTDKITYEGGANQIGYVETSYGPLQGVVGSNSIPINTKTYIDETKYGLVKNSKGNIKITYCKNSNYSDGCLQYNKSNPEAYRTKFGSSTTNKIGGYKVPANNYALFEAKVGVAFYNNEEYQINENNGDVVNVTGSTKHNDLHTLEKYSFPLSVNAFNICTGNECKVTQEINVGMFFRAQTTDPLRQAIKDKKVKCGVSVLPDEGHYNWSRDGSKTGSFANLYRNVDPSNLFPSGLKESTNWSSAEGQVAKKQIESTADLIKQGDQLIDYRITLDPTQIKALKEYNDKIGTYSQEKIYCTDSNVQEDGTYRDCKSEYLNILRNGGSGYSKTELGTIDSDYKDGKSKYIKPFKNQE